MIELLLNGGNIVSKNQNNLPQIEKQEYYMEMETKPIIFISGGEF